MTGRSNLRFRATSIGAFAVCCALLLSTSAAVAESDAEPQFSSSATLPNAPAPQSSEIGPVTIREVPKNILKDEAAIWTSPAQIRAHDLNWLIPLAAVTGFTLATDTAAMRHVAPHDTQLNHRSVQASNAMLGILFAVPAVDFGVGSFGDHEHARETGILSAEAAVNSLVLEQTMKAVSWRERPTADNANGKFWQSSAGADGSFPSSHSVFAWSTAAVIADEYPSFKTKLAVYTLALGVSATRVAGQEHFPSDVLVGSAVGWLAGHYIYKARHRWAQRNGLE